ncbi:ciliated left-right organizer metallopeptidase isoform X2 [Nelusetta ayraudi]|uniref:ciliated left-right organizer metallopeptidase isoform X2 n=1 Tax=Nelusetta ayraudi TaxID=303726 RepID=UPI003F7059AF
MLLLPSQRLWVATLALTLAVVEIPVVLQKCIFDEVQAQTRVIRAAPVQPGDPSVKPEAGAQTGQSGKSRDRRSTLQRALSGRPRRSLRETPSSPQPIRIHSWRTQESSNLLQAERERLQAAVQEALTVASSVLSVNRALGPLLLSRDVNKYCKFVWRNSSTANYNRCGRANHNYQSETCLDVTIPDDHLAGCLIYPEADSPRSIELRPDGAGLPRTDFLLYLHVKTTHKCKVEPSVLAYATHCQTDGRGRPVAGVVVVCRDRLTAAAYSHQTAVQTVIHELFHALGFSRHLFHTWRACSSNATHFKAAQCSPRCKVTQSDATGQTRIYTPSVIWALQRHLVSSEPELGGPLENQDVPSGRASSHWESRTLQGSIMTATLGDPATVRVDAITLAALQDTGWYTVNLTRSQSLVWGQGEGSLFGSLSTCLNKSSAFFCTGRGSAKPTNTLRVVGFTES